MAELIDVSEHNGSVDWKRVARSVDGARQIGKLGSANCALWLR
jgi:hypothetical protein